MLPGIDVSHYQKEIDWKLVKKSGVRFAFFKATEFLPGTTRLYVDTHMVCNAADAAENRIYCAPYHFYRTHIPPAFQAVTFLDVIRDLPYNLRPVLDLELAGKSGAALCADMLEFCEKIEETIGVKPIIYTSGGFWRSYMIADHYSNVECFAGYPLWVAQWSFYLPTFIYPFAGPSFWQYSDRGRIPGIKTNVDLDWFMGSEMEILHFMFSNNPEIHKFKNAERLDT